MVDVNMNARDVEIVWVPPQTDTDERVPTAEEMAASNRLTRELIQMSRATAKPAGVITRPTFTAAIGSKGLTVSAFEAYFENHPALSAIPSSTFTLPSLADTGSSVSRYDRVYLCGASVLITDDITTDIRVTFTWRDQTDALQTVTKENSRRLRDVYFWVWANGEITAAQLETAMTSNEVVSLTVDKASTGVPYGNYRVYPLDAALLSGKTYQVESLELVPILRVWRTQNHLQQGFLWGRNGEKDFEAEFHLQPSYRYVGPNYDQLEGRLRETLWRLMEGHPLSDSPTKDRSVQNLVNGQVGINLDSPGVATASPNGSTALANEQRVTFSNAATLQHQYASPIPATNAGGGEARVSINFSGNSPSGASFADSGHKVFDGAGNDISSAGAFVGSGGTGALTWTETTAGSSTVVPGDTLYLQPVLEYPAGSGFPVCGDIEKVFLNGSAILAANVREYNVDDLTAYATPAGGEAHIAVLDKGRAGLRYLYKKYTASTDGAGVLKIPTGARGAIAFVNGLADRQDKPVVTGLSANTSYDFLCYHAPPGSEQWQFQFVTPRYAGTGETALLTGSTVVTSVVTLSHTHGGAQIQDSAGLGVRDEVVTYRVPANRGSGSQRGYALWGVMRLHGEPAAVLYPTLRETPGLLGGATSQYAGLRAGSTLTAIAAIEAQSQGMAVRLEGDGLQLGAFKPTVADVALGDDLDDPFVVVPTDSKVRYQLLLAAIVAKGDELRLLVVTLNEGDGTGAEAIAIDSDSPHFAGIDLFKLW